MLLRILLFVGLALLIYFGIRRIWRDWTQKFNHDAEEAKRIHYGESEEREIYGGATDEEAEELDDEGIEYIRFPFIRRRDG